MSKLPKVLLLLVLMGTIGTSQVQRPGGAKPAPVLGNAGPAIGSQDELQQYTAGGHVLGFQKGEMFVASGDHALRVEFVNARPVSPAEGAKSQDPENSRQAAKPLGKVSYPNLWDGVTLIYENHGSGVVKSTYHIEAAGTGTIDPLGQIRLRYNVPVKVDDDESLVFSFPTGEMQESRPVAWQEVKGTRIPVEITFRLRGEQEVGFKAGSYDPRYPLVIDPVLSWNTFLGGSNSDEGFGIAMDTSGNVYVTGHSNASWGSPVRPYSTGDAFVAKLNGSGALQWNTFLGGSGYDYGYGIAVDTNGNVYVAGISGTTWGSPVRPFTKDDTFVAKLNGSGVLQWNTFLGGSGGLADYAYGIAVDTNGNVYVTGYSDATWSSPVRPYTAYTDSFVAKLNGSGALQWNTFLGGSSSDGGRAIAVDTSGNVYVTGYSYTTWGSPVRPYSMADAFVAKLNGSGALQWNTFLGGSGYDYGYGIAVDTSGNIYVAGYSAATWGSPVRPYAGNDDAFVAKLNGSGVLQWNTFLGGSTDDYSWAIAVDTSGNVYVAGDSNATWGSPMRPYTGGSDAFASKLNGSGALQWNTFLGGSGNDYGNGIAVDTSGNVYVAGYSGATWGSPVGPYAGGTSDAFVAKLPNSNVKNDFNGDGQDDILWRYYGSGGLNVVWEMGTGSIPAPALGSQAKDNGGMNLLGGQGPERIYWSPLEAGDLLSKRPARSYRSAMEAREQREIAAVYKAPWEVWGKGKGTKVLASPIMGTAVPQTAPSIVTSVPLYPVADTNWEIAGVGDFNGDGKPDILWRNYGTSGWTGTDLVWYMNGTTIAWQELLYTVTDPNWRIVGVGDFNGDTKPDIVWRNYGTGMDVVWYMNCGAIVGQDVLYTVTNPNWKIVGVGDFNGDGKSDILWRDYGTGMNVVWYMNGAAIAGQDLLYTVADANWRIEGVGDYNGDGKPDILWRNYGSGGWTGTNLVWYMNGATIAGQDLLYPVTDLNWRIVIH